MTYPLAVPAIPKTDVLRSWIAAQGWDTEQETGYPLFPGPEILSSPDRAVFLTPTPGPGWVTEEAVLDTWGFQARVRGPADDVGAAELAAQQLDVLILNGAGNTVVRGVLVKQVTRLGSPPVPLPLNPADRRYEFTCSYLITTGLE